MSFRVINEPASSSDILNTLANNVVDSYTITTSTGNRTIPIYSSAKPASKYTGRVTFTTAGANYCCPVLKADGTQLVLPPGTTVSYVTLLNPSAVLTNTMTSTLVLDSTMSTVPVLTTSLVTPNVLSNAMDPFSLTTIGLVGTGTYAGSSLIPFTNNPASPIQPINKVGVNGNGFVYISQINTNAGTTSFDVTIVVV